MTWLFRRRQPSKPVGLPEVGQPPEGAKPMIEPHLQDIGLGSYELPLSEDDAHEEPDSEDSDD
jgi:hypothetical protein